MCPSLLFYFFSPKKREWCLFSDRNKTLPSTGGNRKCIPTGVCSEIALERGVAGLVVGRGGSCMLDVNERACSIKDLLGCPWRLSAGTEVKRQSRYTKSAGHTDSSLRRQKERGEDVKTEGKCLVTRQLHFMARCPSG